jgi:hypothetical protein
MYRGIFAVELTSEYLEWIPRTILSDFNCEKWPSQGTMVLNFDVDSLHCVSDASTSKPTTYKILEETEPKRFTLRLAGLLD